MGPAYPNGTDDPRCNSTVLIGDGLLYNIDTDPWEYTPCADTNPGPFKALSARLAQLQPTFFNPVRTGGSLNRSNNAASERGGYWGPFVFP